MFLRKVKIKENDNCSFCNCYQETIVHLLWDCIKVKTVWNFVRAKILKKCRLTINFTKDSILLGHTNKCMNIVILFVKFYIYRQRCCSSNPSPKGLISFLTDCYKTNKYIATVEQELGKFRYDWKYVYFLCS